jgi:DNA-directed RNA polymerase specialized sigma24 family protein
MWWRSLSPLEDIRRQRIHAPLDDLRIADASSRRAPRLSEPDEDLAIREQHLESLDRTLQELKPEQRELVVEYYRDTGRQQIERRRNLARRLGITMNALGIRACRIRRSLEVRLEACCKEQ